MPTEKQTEASRRNGRKSAGPKTAEGKNRSKFNALKHGMTAKSPVLPGEDEGAFAQRVDAWKDDLQPRGAVEDYLVERAARVSWQLDRIERAHTSRLARQIIEGTAAGDHAQVGEADELGRRLFWDRRGPLPLYPHTPISNALLPKQMPRTSFSDVVDDPDHPAALVHDLESTAAGCQWMLDQWAVLRTLLDQGQAWQSPDKLKAIRLLGRQPLDAADDPRVATIFLAAGFLEPCDDDSDTFDEVWKELLPGQEDRFKQRLEDRNIYDRLPKDEADARAALRDIVDGAASRLRVLAASRRERAEAVAAESADWLAFDTSDEGERLRRYEMACSRSLLRTLNLVLKVRKDTERELDSETADPADTVKSETVAETYTRIFEGLFDDPPPPASVPLVEDLAVIDAPHIDPIPGPIGTPPSIESAIIVMPPVPAAVPVAIDEATGSDSSQPVACGNATKHEIDETNPRTEPVPAPTGPISHQPCGSARCDEDAADARNEPGNREWNDPVDSNDRVLPRPLNTGPELSPGPLIS